MATFYVLDTANPWGIGCGVDDVEDDDVVIELYTRFARTVFMREVIDVDLLLPDQTRVLALQPHEHVDAMEILRKQAELQKHSTKLWKACVYLACLCHDIFTNDTPDALEALHVTAPAVCELNKPQEHWLFKIVSIAIVGTIVKVDNPGALIEKMQEGIEASEYSPFRSWALVVIARQTN